MQYVKIQIIKLLYLQNVIKYKLEIKNLNNFHYYIAGKKLPKYLLKEKNRSSNVPGYDVILQGTGNIRLNTTFIIKKTKNKSV